MKASSRRTPTWDLATRTIHWLVALAIILNLFVVDDGDSLHKWIGYVAAALVLTRVVWGLVAPSNARFSRWPMGINSLKRFVSAQAAGTPINYEGHNPLACFVYVAIWALILALGVSGWMMSLDAYWGEDWLEETHEILSTLLQIGIVGHFVGIAFDAYKFRRRTWMAMITGSRS